MKHAVLILLLLAGCASAVQDDPNVILRVAQFETPPDVYLYAGSVNVRFAVSAANRTKDPVTLNRIEIRTVGSGAYIIRSTSTPLQIKLAPGQEVTVPISLWGFARGGYASSREPVTLRATAYMTGPTGAFVRFLTEYIPQQ